MNAVKDVLRYLARTANCGIKYKKSRDWKLEGFVDADWAGCPADRKSYTVFVNYMSGGPVSWESKKQPTVALSSTEAEYMAVTNAAKEICFLRNIMRELNLCSGEPVILRCNNKAAISLSEKNGYSPRTKHIDVRHHIVVIRLPVN